jgi:hypothetical protein
MGKLKIVSDGTVKGTIVTDADSGTPVEGLQSLNLRTDGGQWFAEMVIKSPDLEITVDSVARVAK